MDTRNRSSYLNGVASRTIAILLFVVLWFALNHSHVIAAPSVRPGNILVASTSIFGDGSEGNLSVSSGQTVYVDDVRSTLSASSSGTILNLTSTTGFGAGQEVLVHQSSGPAAGQYEFATIASIGSGTVTLQSTLQYGYTEDSISRAQVERVHHYHDVLVQNGGILTAHAWDGTSGGIMAWRANGNLTVSLGGTIDLSGKGFRGGMYTLNATAFQGEGTGGPGAQNYLPNGNGGGGGAYNTGGGGGGNGTPGIIGAGDAGENYGRAGNSSGTNDLSLATFGGGGGGQGASDPSYEYRGTNGGALALISAKTISISGSIVANGMDPSGSSLRGEGGGGAGGSILFKGQDVSLGANLVLATGGVAPYQWASSGGAGRIRVEYCDSLSGSTNPPASVFQYYTLTVNAGTGGGADPTPTSNCGTRYIPGTVVQLTPNANSGYGFISWSGCDSVSGNTCTVTMNSDKSVTPTFAGLPIALNKVSPANSLVDQPTNVTLSWSSGTGATSYEYCYDTTNNNSCDGSWISTSSTSVGLSGLNKGSVYYWQVRGRNAAGTTEADGSTWWSFTAVPAVPNDDFGAATVINSLPYTITEDTTIGTTAIDDPILTCTGGQGAASVWFRFTPFAGGTLRATTNGSSYDTVLAIWQVTSASLKSVACNDDVAPNLTSAVSANVIAGSTYYIEVVDYNGSPSLPNRKTNIRTASSAGRTLSLAVGFAPATVRLLFPASASSSTTLPIVLDWTDSTGAAYYQIEVHQTTATGKIILSAKPTVSTFAITSLKAGVYYWRVQACNAVGCSAWTTLWYFKILVPALPKLLSPTNGGAISGSTANLDWSDSLGATRYQIQLRQDSTTGTPVAIPDTGVSSSVTPSLTSGHWYYWNVSACSPAGCSAWTAWWKFWIP